MEDKEKVCNCSENCDCGCKDGQECTCDCGCEDECNCSEDCECGCKDSK